MARRAWFSSLLALVVGCGTIGSAGGGDTDLATIASGPFRQLDDEELPGGDGLTGLAVADAPSGLTLAALPDGRRVLCYALSVAEGPRTLHCTARDAASIAFQHAPAPVLVAELPWEGAELRDPALLTDTDGSLLLYYATDGGLGLARSRDGGGSFTRELDSPLVLAGGWETSPARRPAPVRLRDGLRIYYDGGAGIGFATSPDGITLDEVSPRPILRPGSSGRFDEAAVGAPMARVETTVAGRERVSLWYGALDAEGVASIGYAASWDGESFERLSIPVFGDGNEEADAAYDARDGYTGLLYVVVSRRGRRLVALGISPGNAHLAPAD